MDTQPNESAAANAKRPNSLYRVTPLSKYLAMALFIILPFVAAALGYQYGFLVGKTASYVPAMPVVTESPEVAPVEEAEEVTTEESHGGMFPEIARQTNELRSGYELASYTCEGDFAATSTCYRLLQDTASGNEVVIDNLRTKFLADTKFDRHDIKLLYVPDGGTAAYFSSFLPSSSACCSIVEFSLENLQFTIHELYLDRAMGDTVSPSGRFAAVHGSAIRVDIVDIPTETTRTTIRVNEGESLYSTTCGYAGGSIDVTWESDSVARYGVYADASTEGYDRCQPELLEYRTVRIP